MLIVEPLYEKMMSYHEYNNLEEVDQAMSFDKKNPGALF